MDLTCEDQYFNADYILNMSFNASYLLQNNTDIHNSVVGYSNMVNNIH